MGGLFQGIPPFAGEGIASGQALQAAYWDLKNQIIANPTGNVSGVAPSTNFALPLWSGVGADTLINSAIIGTAAGSISLPAGQTMTAPIFRGIGGANVQLIADSGGEVIINDNANNAAGSIGVDFSGTGGFIKIKDGAAAGVSIGNSATNGLMFGANTVSISTNGVEKWMVNSSGALNPIAANTYDIGGATTIRDIGVGRNVIVGGIVSAAAGAVGAPSYTFTGNLTDGFYSVSGTQIGTAINGALVGGWDASGLFTGTISEQVGSAGVTFPNDIHALNIKSSGVSDLLISNIAGGSEVQLRADGELFLTTSANGDLDITVDGAGVITMNGADTYTGTVAGSAALNIVNGLVMA